MANVRKRQNGVFCVNVRMADGRRIRQSLKIKNRRDALKVRDVVEKEIAQTQLTVCTSDVLEFEEARDAFARFPGAQSGYA